jgi:hypothetical protein
MKGLLMLLSPYSPFSKSIQKISVEQNVIAGGITQIIR